MGINSYITHRMFVAALSHDEPQSAKESQPHQADETMPRAKARPQSTSHSSAQGQAEAATRRWMGSAVTIVL
jgi:hypothetical protein